VDALPLQLVLGQIQCRNSAWLTTTSSTALLHVCRDTLLNIRPVMRMWYGCALVPNN